MQELAGAALALHELLVEEEERILYDPAVQSGLSRDPVVEAIPLDTVLHDRMWVLLERIFASLEHVGGELGASRDNLTRTLLERIDASRTLGG